MEKVCLSASNITTSYKKFSVSNINFNLCSGDIMGFVGRSGSGKSTIMKTLLGFKTYDSGNIELIKNNNPVEIKLMIGYSPQDNSLFPYLTLKENLFTFGRLNGVKKEQIEKRTVELLKRLGLTGHENKKIMDFSGGMRKRADLAITLIHEPSIIILDEPFNGLDISLQSFIWKLVKDLSKQGKIIIISSHMIQDIQKYCNKIGLIENGIFYDNSEVNTLINKLKQKTLCQFLENVFADKIQI